MDISKYNKKGTFWVGRCRIPERGEGRSMGEGLPFSKISFQMSKFFSKILIIIETPEVRNFELATVYGMYFQIYRN